MRDTEKIARLERACEDLTRLCSAQQAQIAELERSLVMVAEIVRNNNGHLQTTMEAVVEHDRIIRQWQQYETET